MEDFIEQATLAVEADWKGPRLPVEHMRHPDRPRYEKAYGQWAGQPAGKKPDFTRCCESVYSHPGHISHQCSRKAKHDPDHTGKPTSCSVHSSEARKKRAIKSHARYLRDRALFKRRNDSHDFARDAKALIKSIAAGHNDARGAAADLVAKYPGVFDD